MADTAQPASPLFGKLRSSFGRLSGGGVASVPASAPAPVVTPALVTTTNNQKTNPLSTESKLATLEQVLTEVEQQTAAAVAATSVVAPQLSASAQTLQPPQPQQPFEVRQQNVGLVAQAAPAAVSQALYQQQVQMAQTSGPTTAKETFVATAAPTETISTASVVEAAAGVQYVEQEPTPEIPPEVSEYLTHVENHANQQPQEIVIAEAQQNVPLATNYPKQSVIVLPITPDTESAGKTKGPFESIRWLVEWSFKMMKVFSGRIIYRQVEPS